MLTHGSSQVCEVYLKRDASMPDIWQPTVFMRSNMAEFLDTSCLYAIIQLNCVIPSGFMQSNIAEFIETGFSSVVIKAV